MGCNFCTTSAFFGGKGKFVNFYETGEELFDVMCDGGDARCGVQSFFIMDENFLLHKKRAMELLDLMKERGQGWSLYVFSSANAIREVHHATSWSSWASPGSGWGSSRRRSSYAKLEGADTLALTRELQSHGIRVLGSTIVGLEHHTPENIARGDRARRRARHRLPPVHALHAGAGHAALRGRWRAKGRMLTDVDLADIHGQYKFNFQHAAIPRDESKTLARLGVPARLRANGPSLYRMMRTMLEGWKRYRNDPDPRVRERVATAGTRAAARLRRGALGDGEVPAGVERDVSRCIRELRRDMEHELGPLTRQDRPGRGARAAVVSARRDARKYPGGAHRAHDVCGAPELA